LESLVLRKAPQWNVNSVRQLIHDGIDLIVVVQKSKKGVRFISEIARPSGIEEFGILVESL
jgi:Flp pilus assembly CpaF family ATPase